MTERTFTAPPDVPPPPDSDYPGTTKAGAILFALFAPLLSLVVALVLMGSERNPIRRASLRAWAWLSGTIIAIGIVIAIALFAAFASHATGGVSNPHGVCIGGPKMGAPAERVGPHRYRVPCEMGGSTIVRLP